jgi:type IV secretion system protein VirB1
MDFLALSLQCAPDVNPSTLQHIVKVESSFNPYAIGVVGAHLVRQPRDASEALATANWLDARGFNFSVGLTQVNKKNLMKYNLPLSSAFEPCSNLRAGGEILKECYGRAKKKLVSEQAALRAAFSCYYSGNFTTGFKDGYVLKVVSGKSKNVKSALAVDATVGSKIAAEVAYNASALLF